MPIHRKTGCIILRDEYFHPKELTLLPEYLPSDLMMYLLLTDQFKQFVIKNKDDILSLLTKEELYYASIK